MKQELDLLGYVQFDHQIWLNELLFAHQEIKIYESRLSELIEETDEERTGSELADLYKSFNQRDEKVAELIQKIRKHMVNNTRLVKSNGNLKTMIDTVHSVTRKEMEEFRKDYAELKKRFARFAVLHNRFL